jgi:adenylylsulfate kinase-like enzyme
VDPADLLVFGYDLEPACGQPHGKGIPRGVRIDRVPNHVFISGMSGCGKTMLVTSLAIQLHNLGITYKEGDA